MELTPPVPTARQLAHRQRLAKYWQSPEGRQRRSELSRRPEHLERLKKARDARTADQIEKTLQALIRWNESPEGVMKALERLEKIHREWSPSPENMANLRRVHDSWARSPEGRAIASAHRYGMQNFVKGLRKRDGDRCQLCLEPMNFRLKKPNPLRVSVDHIIPVRAGGGDEQSNLWLAHLLCNMKKGARYCGREDGSCDSR